MYSVFRCLMKMKVEQNLSEVLDDLSHNSTRNSSIFTFDNVSNISLDNRKKIYNEDEIDEIDEFTTYEESQVRLIMKVKQKFWTIYHIIPPIIQVSLPLIISQISLLKIEKKKTMKMKLTSSLPMKKVKYVCLY